MFQFVITASGPLTRQHWKEPGSVFFTTSILVFVHINKSPLSLILSRMSSSLSLSSYVRCSNTLIILLALHWSLSGVSMSLFYWEAQNWMQHSSCDLCSAEVERKDYLPWPACNSPPNWAQDTVTLLSHKGTSLSFVQLGVHHDLKSLFCQTVFQLGGWQHTLVHGAFHPYVQNFALLLLNFMRFLSVYISRLWGSLWMELSGVTTTPPSLVLSSGLPRVHCASSSESLKKMLNIFINLPLGYAVSYWTLTGICDWSPLSVSSHSARFQSIWFGFGEAVLTSDDLLVINVPRNGFQNQILHYPLWNQGDID